jgi:hypothetical protein
MARHSCIRDETELLRINNNIKDEVMQFMSPSRLKRAINDFIQKEINLEQGKDERVTREKRAIGLIGAGIGAGYLGIESLHSLIMNLNPMSLMGKGLAAIFGFATNDPLLVMARGPLHGVRDLFGIFY